MLFASGRVRIAVWSTCLKRVLARPPCRTEILTREFNQPCSMVPVVQFSGSQVSDHAGAAQTSTALCAIKSPALAINTAARVRPPRHRFRAGSLPRRKYGQPSCVDTHDNRPFCPPWVLSAIRLDSRAAVCLEGRNLLNSTGHRQTGAVLRQRLSNRKATVSFEGSLQHGEM